MTSLDERYAVMLCNDMSPVERQAFLEKLSFYTHRDWRYDHLGSIRSTYVLCEIDMSLRPHWQQRLAGRQAMNTKPQEIAAALLTPK